MIAYIRGILTEVRNDSIVVESNGIGFEINVPLTVIESLPHLEEEIKIFTYFRVSEDAMNLYGFTSRKDEQMFEQLISVSGIGPKAALNVLSTLTPDDLRMAVISADDKAIAKAPGVGVKMAQRIILDLKDKVSMDDILGADKDGSNTAGVSPVYGSAAQEAIAALVSLGYSASEATRAVRSVDADTDDSEVLLKAALRKL